MGVGGGVKFIQKFWLRFFGHLDHSAPEQDHHHVIVADIGVGAQSTLGGGGTTFLPEKYVWKINKMPEFYAIIARKKYPSTRIFMIFAQKINKIPEFYAIFARKMPEFDIIIARKIFFPIFFFGGGARAHCPPPSSTPVVAELRPSTDWWNSEPRSTTKNHISEISWRGCPAPEQARRKAKDRDIWQQWMKI